MKSVIVTTQDVKNYGAVLQAYAFHKFLEDNGFEHSFLVRSEVKKNGVKPKLFSKAWIKTILQSFVNGVNKKQLTKQTKNFASFRSEHFHEITKHQVTSDYGVYITGGDQMWNRSCLWRDINLLRFGEDNAVRISFCTSMGSAKFSESELEIIKSALSKYSEISVREQSAIDVLNKAGGVVSVPTRIDIDCSFLLDKPKYDEIAVELDVKLPEEYILVYRLLNHSDLKKVIKLAKKKYNLPVVVVEQTPEMSGLGDYTLRSCGPREFLWLFAHAKFVITTSFHGTCFSIINEVPFISLMQNNEKRITSLLKNCNLQDRGITSFCGELPNHIDFSMAKNYIEQGRKSALEYLTKYLGE